MPDNTLYKTPGEHGAPLPHHHDGNQWRALGLLPNKPNAAGLPRFADHHDLIPRSKWKPVDYSGFKVRIMDQGQHGSCVGHGSAGAFEKAWLMSGATPHEFSPCFVYALGNGGRDAGMVISDAAQILQQYGICLESEVPEGNIWKSQVPSSAYETAKRFRLVKLFHGDSFDAIGTGLQLGFIPFYGTYVGGDFGDVDKEGVAPYHNAMGNHCMYGDGLTLLPSGRWAIEDINSWGTRWGNQGRTRLVEQHFNEYCDAIMIQVVGEDPQETNKPWKVG